MRKRLPWLLWVVLLGVGLVIGPAVGDETESKAQPAEKSAKKSGARKNAKASKSEPADETPPQDNPDPDEPQEKTDGDDGEGFGSDRKKETKSLDDKEKLRVERERKKFQKILERRLGREDEGYFVFQTWERKFKPTTAEEAARIGPYKPEETMEFHVCEGRDATVAYLLDFLTEYALAKPLSARERRNAIPTGPPPPQRDWKLIDRFAADANGSLLANAAREKLQTAYEERLKAIEYEQQAQRNAFQ